MPTCSSLEEYIALASRLVWGVNQLRPMQMARLLRLFDPSKSKRKLLVVQQTVVGKAHAIRIIGTMLMGIHLIMHLLLVFVASQVKHSMEGNIDYGVVEVHNLNKQVATSAAISKTTYTNLTNLVCMQPFWIHAIFNRTESSVCNYHVEGFFLQLISADLITTKKRNNGLMWVKSGESN